MTPLRPGSRRRTTGAAVGLLALFVATTSVHAQSAPGDSGPGQSEPPATTPAIDATGTSDATAGAAAAASREAAAALFAELGTRLGARPLYVVAALDITRGGTTRSLVLRVHLRGPGHVLVQVHEPPRTDGSRAAPREDGTVLLLHEGQLNLWFPRAELALVVPAMLAGSRLCGSDLALDHVLALAGDGTRWHAAGVADASLSDEPCQRLLLLPGPIGAAPTDAPTDTDFASMELLVTRGARGELIARQLDGFDDAGVLVSRVRLDSTRSPTARRESTHGAGLPDAWTAWTLPPRDTGAPDVSILRVRFSERDPPIAPAIFLPGALTAWR